MRLRYVSTLRVCFGLVALLSLEACSTDTFKKSQGQVITPNGAVTNSADDLRTGWYPNQPNMDPVVVGGPTFGRLWKTTLPQATGDQVFAQPLLWNNRLLIVTESNNIYSL